MFEKIKATIHYEAMQRYAMFKQMRKVVDTTNIYIETNACGDGSEATFKAYEELVKQLDKLFRMGYKVKERYGDKE